MSPNHIKLTHCYLTTVLEYIKINTDCLDNTVLEWLVHINMFKITKSANDLDAISDERSARTSRKPVYPCFEGSRATYPKIRKIAQTFVNFNFYTIIAQSSSQRKTHGPIWKETNSVSRLNKSVLHYGKFRRLDWTSWSTQVNEILQSKEELAMKILFCPLQCIFSYQWKHWQANFISHQMILWAGEIEERREDTNTSTHTQGTRHTTVPPQTRLRWQAREVEAIRWKRDAWRLCVPG